MISIELSGCIRGNGGHAELLTIETVRRLDLAPVALESIGSGLFSLLPPTHHPVIQLKTKNVFNIKFCLDRDSWVRNDGHLI